MSFDAFSGVSLRDLIADARDTPKLSLLLGAGTSLEAGLPSWSALIEPLLARAGTASGTLVVTDEEGTRRRVSEPYVVTAISAPPPSSRPSPEMASSTSGFPLTSTATAACWEVVVAPTTGGPS